MNVTEEQAKKVASLIDYGLVSGLGSPEPGKMCIEAVVCHALGLPHSDDPGCVMEPLRRLKIRLNDSRWSSNEARAKGMKRLGLIQLGSLDMDQKEFKDRVNRLRMQMIVPIRFRLAAKKHKTDENRKLLEDAALKLEQNPTREQCFVARGVANGPPNSNFAGQSCPVCR